MTHALASRLSPTMVVVVLAFLTLLALVQKGDAYEFKVGGSGDWSLTSTSYNQWAEHCRFQVGDSLLFKYYGDKDSVLEVSKDDYNNCNTGSPIAKQDDGHTLITFDRPGPYYFISGVSEHCKHNEKVMIIVIADRNSHKSSPPSPSPSSDKHPSPPSDEKPNGASSLVTSLFYFIGAFACFLNL